MADTEYGVGAPEAVKLWSRRLAREVLKETFVGRFMGTDSNSMIQIHPDTSENAGDRVRVTLRMQLSGAGIAGDEDLEGQEEALTTFTDDVLIDQLRHAVRSKGKMTEQRIPWSIREEARLGLTDWWADRWDTWFFNQVCGNNVTGSDVKFTGMQAVLPPTTNHIIRGGGKTTDELLLAADAFTLSLVDQAVVKAKTISPGIRPIRVPGIAGPVWVMFVHPFQAKSMRTEAGDANWLEIQKAAMAGMNSSKSPIFSGALGMHNQVVLHEATRVTTGVNSTTFAAIPNARRAVLCGAQAAVTAFGEGNSFNRASWSEKLFDYGNKLGTKAGFIAGLKKSQYNSADFATIVVSTFATESGA